MGGGGVRGRGWREFILRNHLKSGVKAMQLLREVGREACSCLHIMQKCFIAQN